MVITLDCELPSPYLGGNWRPSACNATVTLMQAIEALAIYVCENLGGGGIDNNLRVVPGGTGTGAFNAEFNGGTPATDAMVVEGDNIWNTSNAGASWDLVHDNSFQVNDVYDTPTPTAADLRDLFPNDEPANDAMVYNVNNKHLFITSNAGVSWTDVHYVDGTGDTMTGTLIMDVDVTDSPDAPLPVLGIDIGVTHTLTADNTAEPIGLNVVSTFDVDDFNGFADGPVGVHADAVVITGGGGTGATGNAIAYEADVTISGTGSVDDAILFYANTPDITGATVANAYGLLIENIAGATNNYAVLTNDGIVQFNDETIVMRSEIDAAASFTALAINADQTITGNNNSEVTGIDVISTFTSDAFDNTGTIWGIKSHPNVKLSAGGSLYQAVAGAFRIDTTGAGDLNYATTIYIEAPTEAAGSTIANAYGIYMDAITAGTANFAMYIGGGESYFEDNLVVDGSRDVVQARIHGSPVQTNLILRVDTHANALCLTVDNNQKVYVGGELEVDGALNHDGTAIGFNGVAPTTQSAGWAVTNPVTRKTYDTTTVTLPQLAEVVGTMIDYLKLRGDFGA